MTEIRPVRAGIVGVGGMARHYIRHILSHHADDTELVAFCEPSAASMAAVEALYAEFDRTPPPNEPDFDRFAATVAGTLDAVFIMTPHAFHHAQAKACLEAGVDVLLEKPMVMTADEARSLIAVRDRTGRHLVVAFQGSLSPEVRTAARLIREGEIGELRSISASIWQNWRGMTEGTWRQQPELSGGGFMFDTGAPASAPSSSQPPPRSAACSPCSSNNPSRPASSSPWPSPSPAASSPRPSSSSFSCPPCS